MAILCLATDEADLRRRIENILLGYRYDGSPFRVSDLGIAGSIMVLLKDALQPNLVQTTENTPAFVHGGPFANIAHGCNTIIATNSVLIWEQKSSSISNVASQVCNLHSLSLLQRHKG